MPVDYCSWRRQTPGQPIKRIAKCPKEARCHRFARQHIAHAQREGESGFLGLGSEALQGRELRAGRSRERNRRRTDAYRSSRKQKTARLPAQRADEAALGRCAESFCGSACCVLRIGGLHGVDTKRAMSSDERRSRYARRLARGCAEPGAGWHVFPHHFVAERAKQLAEIVDLPGAGENVPQHPNPSCKEELRCGW